MLSLLMLLLWSSLFLLLTLYLVVVNKYYSEAPVDFVVGVVVNIVVVALLVVNGHILFTGGQ